MEQEEVCTTHSDKTTDGRSTAAGLAYFSETEALRADATTDPNEAEEITIGGASDARVMSQLDFRFVFNPKDMRNIEFMVDKLEKYPAANLKTLSNLAPAFSLR